MSTLLKLQVAQITNFPLPQGNVSPFSPVALLRTSNPVSAAGLCICSTLVPLRSCSTVPGRGKYWEAPPGDPGVDEKHTCGQPQARGCLGVRACCHGTREPGMPVGEPGRAARGLRSPQLSPGLTPASPWLWVDIFQVSHPFTLESSPKHCRTLHAKG